MSNTSAHPGLGTLTDVLDDMWIEIGKRKWCPNSCKYCFSEEIEDDPLNALQLYSILGQFKKAGGKSLAIPGAGEPFHPQNQESLWTVLDYCNENEISVTIFTEGTLITEEIADKLKPYKNTRLLIKYNSLDPKVQDDLVQRKGYSSKRNDVIKMLIDKGYANKDDSVSRVGIVTSIMTENMTEMKSLLRFARDNGLIFDCDTIIDRGNGKECGLKLEESKVRDVVKELQKIDKEEYGKDWKITSTYIGSPPCTRFNRHIYIRQNGTVHPCVGSPGVVLGDAKKQTLAEIWDSEVMKIIRNHHYIGPCTTCQNYKEKECYSCLGRRAPNLTTEKILAKKAVPLETTCFNYKE